MCTVSGSDPRSAQPAQIANTGGNTPPKRCSETALRRSACHHGRHQKPDLAETSDLFEFRCGFLSEVDGQGWLLGFLGVITAAAAGLVGPGSAEYD